MIYVVFSMWWKKNRGDPGSASNY